MERKAMLLDMVSGNGPNSDLITTRLSCWINRRHEEFVHDKEGLGALHNSYHS